MTNASTVPTTIQLNPVALAALQAAADRSEVDKPETNTREVNWTNNKRGRDLIAEYKRLKAIEAEGAKAERLRKAVEVELKAELAGAGVVIVRGIPALKTSSFRPTHKYDTNLLLEAFPEAYQAVHTVDYYTFFTAS